MTWTPRRCLPKRPSIPWWRSCRHWGHRSMGSIKGKRMVNKHGQTDCETWLIWKIDIINVHNIHSSLKKLHVEGIWFIFFEWCSSYILKWTMCFGGGDYETPIHCGQDKNKSNCFLGSWNIYLAWSTYQWWHPENSVNSHLCVLPSILWWEKDGIYTKTSASSPWHRYSNPCQSRCHLFPRYFHRPTGCRWTVNTSWHLCLENDLRWVLAVWQVLREAKLNASQCNKMLISQCVFCYSLHIFPVSEKLFEKPIENMHLGGLPHASTAGRPGNCRVPWEQHITWNLSRLAEEKDLDLPGKRAEVTDVTPAKGDFWQLDDLKA